MGGNRNICMFANDKLIYKCCYVACKRDKQILHLQTSHGTYANVIRLNTQANDETKQLIQHNIQNNIHHYQHNINTILTHR